MTDGSNTNRQAEAKLGAPDLVRTRARKFLKTFSSNRSNLVCKRGERSE